MLKFRNLLNFPSYYSKRNNSVNTVFINHVNINKIDNDHILVSATTNNKYITNIFTPIKVNLDSPVQISCTCDSFKFEFAYALYQINSLYNFENYILKKSTKNKMNIPSPCKHIIALAKKKVNKFLGEIK